MIETAPQRTPSRPRFLPATVRFVLIVAAAAGWLVLCYAAL